MNCPTNGVDIHGLSFIALGGRDVSGTKGLFGHYSIEYWWTPIVNMSEPRLFEELSTQTFSTMHSSCVKKESIEILNGKDRSLADPNLKYHVWWWGKSKNGPLRWRKIAAHVATINYSDSATTMAVLVHGPDKQIKMKWEQLLSLAKNYRYAEQSGFNGSFRHWPRSEYRVVDGDGTFDNVVIQDFNDSNTFIRYLMRMGQVGQIPTFELRGGKTKYAGRMMPKDDLERYSSFNGQIPFKPDALKERPPIPVQGEGK